MRLRLLALYGLLLAACLFGLVAADNYNTAGRWVCTGACTIPDGGTAARATSLTYGHSSITAHTFTTDGTGNTEIVLPADSIGTAELTQPAIASFNVCGEATTINNNTVYYGPGGEDGTEIDLVANAFNGQACDINNAGSTTEANEHAKVFTNKAVGVVGMVCRNEGDANAAISYTLRSAAAPTVPSVTCSIADNERDCVADIQTTTDIAAGATVAIAAASTSDVGDGNGFVCQVFVTF